MLYSYSRAWSLAQKTLIIVAIIASLFVCGALIYQSERYHCPSDELFFGEWQGMDGDQSERVYWRFGPDHTFSYFVISPLTGEKLPVWEGRWYAGGPFLYLRFAPEQEWRDRVVLRFDVSQQHLTIQLPHSRGVMWSLERVSETHEASNQAMQLTAPRSVSPLRVATTFNFQPRALPGAVADLVSR